MTAPYRRRENEIGHVRSKRAASVSNSRNIMPVRFPVPAPSLGLLTMSGASNGSHFVRRLISSRAHAEMIVVHAVTGLHAITLFGFLVVESGISKFGVLGQNVVKLSFDFGGIVRAGKYLADGLDDIVGFEPSFLLGEFEERGEIALDGGFDGLIALNVFEVPDTEGHEGQRRQGDGQLQFKEHFGAVGQAPLLGIAGILQPIRLLRLTRL